MCLRTALLFGCRCCAKGPDDGLWLVLVSVSAGGLRGDSIQDTANEEPDGGLTFVSLTHGPLDSTADARETQPTEASNRRQVLFITKKEKTPRYKDLMCDMYARAMGQV